MHCMVFQHCAITIPSLGPAPLTDPDLRKKNPSIRIPSGKGRGGNLLCVGCVTGVWRPSPFVQNHALVLCPGTLLLYRDFGFLQALRSSSIRGYKLVLQFLLAVGVFTMTFLWGKKKGDAANPELSSCSSDRSVDAVL